MKRLITSGSLLAVALGVVGTLATVDWASISAALPEAWRGAAPYITLAAVVLAAFSKSLPEKAKPRTPVKNPQERATDPGKPIPVGPSLRGASGAQNDETGEEG